MLIRPSSAIPRSFKFLPDHLHHVAPVDDRHPREFLHPRGEKPPSLLMPGKDHHGICTREHPLDIPR